MRFRYLSILSAIMVTGGVCLAQTNLPAAMEDFKPVSSNQPGKQYPQVNSEGRVRASISAPQAQKVQLDLGGVRYDLIKDETGWAVQGKANFILDNLIAEKKAVPMIDATYRTLSDRGHRAMAGLSMGANRTIQITMNNLDKFSYIGGFSGTSNFPGTAEIDPATFMNGKFKDGEALNEQIKLFWLGLGTKEPNPFPGSIGAFRAMLDKTGVKYVYYESQGTAHEWLTWRRDLFQFAPMLFKK